jgi:hypothetical protein
MSNLFFFIGVRLGGGGRAPPLQADVQGFGPTGLTLRKRGTFLAMIHLQPN